MNKLKLLLLMTLFLGVFSCSTEELTTEQVNESCAIYQDFYCEMEGMSARIFDEDVYVVTDNIQNWFEDGGHLPYKNKELSFWVWETENTENNYGWFYITIE